MSEAALLAVAKEQLRWQRAAAMSQVRETIAEALATTTAPAKAPRSPPSSASQNRAFSGWTRNWRNLGIAYEVDGRRIKHLVSLVALGLSLEVE